MTLSNTTLLISGVFLVVGIAAWMMAFRRCGLAVIADRLVLIALSALLVLTLLWYFAGERPLGPFAEHFPLMPTALFALIGLGIWRCGEQQRPID